MLTYNTHFIAQFRKLIAETIQNKMENMINSHSVMDFPAYKYQVGMIEGLKAALELVDEAESIADGNTTRGS